MEKLEYHISKCELILANTRDIYDREQAIFKTHFLRPNVDLFIGRVDSLADDLIARTNLIETADEHIHGEHELYLPLRISLHKSILDDWLEFYEWETRQIQ